MSYSLADLPMDERRAMEEHKAELFEFWKANKERCYGDAALKEKKGKGWRAWADLELAGMEPQQYRNMVTAEMNRLQSGKPRE
ncbi:hypothetical protein [Pseudomonas sp. Snoq117.2]|uniref:hypothetical protein n=1 Tax=Pseudomonas sp. Snoq117.2 TaxID=1500302 RepID=UPI0008D00779|nr:hypothetical protein [Pseudomonas sp. Snoq117.2]SEO43596.1 hypothetical protein SAMN02787149_10166 [Pseudomonas sp. Snoq117.2]